jgi:hypothetical protein
VHKSKDNYFLIKTTIVSFKSLQCFKSCFTRFGLEGSVKRKSLGELNLAVYLGRVMNGAAFRTRRYLENSAQQAEQ